MSLWRSGLAALGVLTLGLLPGRASAQVAFVPTVGAFPNGVTLSTTPVVSADRRYVRLGMNPVFTGLEGFETYNVPGAISGGGVGLRSVGMAHGMDGPIVGPGGVAGPASAAAGASAFLSGGPQSREPLRLRPERQPRSTRASRLKLKAARLKSR